MYYIGRCMLKNFWHEILNKSLKTIGLICKALSHLPSGLWAVCLCLSGSSSPDCLPSPASSARKDLSITCILPPLKAACNYMTLILLYGIKGWGGRLPGRWNNLSITRRLIRLICSLAKIKKQNKTKQNNPDYWLRCSTSKKLARVLKRKAEITKPVPTRTRKNYVTKETR